ncbi:hypothetical protein Peur_050182 [Populus x canadensis]
MVSQFRCLSSWNSCRGYDLKIKGSKTFTISPITEPLSTKNIYLVAWQTSTRWTPTTDQIRILKELYYIKGVRSPNGAEIQQISARLRKYGKIEGKNVFYWFQNHKARERQKKRFTNEVPTQQRTTLKPEDYYSYKYSGSNNNPGFSSASSSSNTGAVTVGQADNYGYGSVTMQEKKNWVRNDDPENVSDFMPLIRSFDNAEVGVLAYAFANLALILQSQRQRRNRKIFALKKDCSVPAGGESMNNINYGSRGGINPYSSSYTVFDQDQEAAEKIETLPLFPMHGEDISTSFNINNINPDFYYSSWYGSDDYGNATTSRTSLELSLYSYNGQQQDY